MGFSTRRPHPRHSTTAPCIVHTLQIKQEFNVSVLCIISIYILHISFQIPLHLDIRPGR